MNIIIAGDFTTEDRGDDAVRKENAISDDIKGLLRSSDYCIVNLEAPVANDSHKPLSKSGPNLKTRDQTIKYLKDCGFHAVTLANNHFCDYGKGGVQLTIEKIEEHGLDHVGGGRTKEELEKPLVHHSKEGTIAILNYCEHEFSIQSGYGSNALDPIKVFYDIQKVKKGADIIIIIVHGGSEGYQLPSPRMQKLYRCFVDMGANAVVNHHQHCYSGYEKYHGGIIYYGLGNFFFDDKNANDSIWNEGYLVKFDVNNKRITEQTILPYVQCLNDRIDVHLMAKGKEERFYKSISKLNSIIADETKLEKEFHSFCQLKSNNYYSAFSPYSNRYLRYLCKHGLLPSFVGKSKRYELLNYLECESHWDILMYSLKSKIQERQ